MGSPRHSSPIYHPKNGQAADPTSAKLGLWPLVFLTFYSVSGGAFGIEQIVQAAGPLYALLGFSLLLVWALPEALVTAELSSALPEASGSVAWVHAAFGPFWGFQKGWLSWLSGVSDNSLYPMLFLDGMVAFINTFDGAVSVFADGWPRWAFIITSVAVLTYFNYRGLEFVGSAVTVICVFTLLPFIVFCIYGMTEMDYSRLLEVPANGLHGVKWRLLLNTFFWNINYWESAAAYSGDVQNPGRDYPRGMCVAVVLVTISLFLPVFVGIGASKVPYEEWTDGSFTKIATDVAGPWLGYWMMAASAVTNVGMFEAEMSSDAWQVAGMAEKGILPKVLGTRNKYNAPTYGIIMSATGIAALATLSFSEVIDILNLLYCMAQIIEFFAFIELRRSHENLHRPYRIPVNLFGAVLLMTLPLLFVLLIFMISSLKIVLMAIVGAISGVVVYYVVEIARDRGWCEFEPLDEVSYMTVSEAGSEGGEEGSDDSFMLRKPDETSSLLGKGARSTSISS